MGDTNIGGSGSLTGGYGPAVVQRLTSSTFPHHLHFDTQYALAIVKPPIFTAHPANIMDYFQLEPQLFPSQLKILFALVDDFVFIPQGI